MKIKIANFGPIEEFEYDLEKDLIITYGKNNIGKSYAMSLVYIVIKHFIDKNLLYYKLIKTDDIKYNKKITEIEKKIMEGEEQDITEVIIEMITNKLDKGIVTNIEKSFKNTFGDIENIRNKRSMKYPTFYLELNNIHIEFIIDGILSIKKLSLSKKIICKMAQSGIKSRKGKDKIYIYYTKENQNFTETIFKLRDEIEYEIIEHFEKKINGLFFFPASKSGIYTGMSAFTQIIAELSKSRAFISNKIEMPALSEPISDYFIKLAEINHEIQLNSNISDVILKLESEILHGKVGFDDKKKVLTYKPENSDIELQMAAVSSMVSEIVPIVAFFKYIYAQNKKNDSKKNNGKYLLFIEEPEAHLHPELQVKLIEFLVEIIKVGVKLIITSHSNYFFNKINNMILDKKLDFKLYSPILLKEGLKGSISKIMEIDELGVSDENFIDISENLYEERDRIIEELNQEE